MILTAFILRLLVVYFQYSGDIGNHLAWADSFLLHGPFGFFERYIPGFNLPNYPPLAIYLFVISRLFYLQVYSLAFNLNQLLPLFPSALIPILETLNSQAAFMKLPAIFAGLGIGALIIKLTKSKLLAALYLFNPAIIYISSIWGQIEAVPVFFLLLSLYFYEKKTKSNFILSNISFTLALLSKQTALWLLPIYLILWAKSGWKNFLSGLLSQLLVFIFFYFPFTTFSLVEPFSLYFSTLAGSSTVIADAAWNFWVLFLPANLSDSTYLGPLTVRYWSLLFLFIAYLSVCFSFYKNKLNLFTSLFLLSLAAFFLQTRVHERHLFPVLVFLLLTPIKLRYRIVVYILLSFYHMLNLYASLKLPFI